MSESARSAGRAVSFGSFRLLPAQQLLLEDEAPVRLGGRALEILTALVERAGELVSKNELMTRVWPDTFVDENTLRVHVASLRRALGDGQPGRRYLTNVPGRGYCFVAPVDLSEPAGEAAPKSTQTGRAHNLPISQARAVGRSGTIGALLTQLPVQRLITIVGAGGIGKTTVALALAEARLQAYADGVWFVDLAPLNDARLVPSTLASTLGLGAEAGNTVSRLIELLRHKTMLVVLDSCEHVVEAVAELVEQLLAGAPGIHILATSREPLRAEGERVHRLLPLEIPPDQAGLAASEAIAFSSVQLFVERAAASVDGFLLGDDEAPIVANICRKLGGVALAIELAAARVDAFGIKQLAVLLDDRFRILNQGRRTAQPRHRSLDAALDWSYEFLPETERVVLRRLSIFANAFTLDAALALAGADTADMVEGIANLVAKSLISADVGGAAVQYRLLDTTRAYAQRKLIEGGEFQECARRHAEYFRDLIASAPLGSQFQPATEEMVHYVRDIDNVRAALDWSFSPAGDPSIGIALTAAYARVWIHLGLMPECRERTEHAFDRLESELDPSGLFRIRLGLALGLALFFTMGAIEKTRTVLTDALETAERIDDLDGQLRALWLLWAAQFFAGECRTAQSTADRFSRVGARSSDSGVVLLGDRMVGYGLHYRGRQREARDCFDRLLERFRLLTDRRRATWARYDQQILAQAMRARVLWLQGFVDQAAAEAQACLRDAIAKDYKLSQCEVLHLAVCPIALTTGNLDAAEQGVALFEEIAAAGNATNNKIFALGLKGTLLTRRGEFEQGIALLRSAADMREQTGWRTEYPELLGTLAESLAGVGRYDEAFVTMDRALAEADRGGERWYFAELLRIKGELLLRGERPSVPAAEESYNRAIEVARQQGALFWELRAALNLARLRIAEDRRADARQILAPVYDRFTEGFETADMQSASALLRSP